MNLLLHRGESVPSTSKPSNSSNSNPMNKSNQQLNGRKTVKQIQPTNPITGCLRVSGLIILLIALTIHAGNSAHGALLAYEGFDYPDGSSIDGQNGGLGWTNAWYDPLAVF